MKRISGQINIFCPSCWHWERILHKCEHRYNPDNCTRYERKYTCPGGLVRKEQMSKAGCRECARRCGGCLHMAVAYGFVKRADVEHLLDCQPFPWPGYSKDWRARE